MSMGNHCESWSRWARLYGVSYLVKCSAAGMKGQGWFGNMQFCGLDDNLGFMAQTSGCIRGGCTKAGDPLEDVLGALACTSARDLDIG